MYLYISFVCVCLCVLEYVCVYSTKKIHQSYLYPLPLSPMLQAITSCKWPPTKILVTLQVSCAPIAIAQCRLLFYWPHTRTPGVVGEEREGEWGGRWARGRYFKVDSIQSCRGYLGTMCHHRSMTNWSLSGGSASAKAWLLLSRLLLSRLLYINEAIILN